MIDLLKSEFLEFFKAQTDKLLLTVLIIFMICILLHLVHHESASAVIPWLEKSVDVVLGSLITLVTGQIFRKSEEKK